MKSTKDQLSDALKSLLGNQTLSQITVSDIANECGMSRMTFYYHFHGTKDAVSYMLARLFREDGVSGTYDTVWMDSIENLFQCMKENKQVFRNVYESIGHDQVQEIISCALAPVAEEQIGNATRKMHLTDEDKAFVTNFFGNAIVGVCFDWIDAGMDDAGIDIMVCRCGTALQNSVMNVLKAYDKKNRAKEKALEDAQTA